MQNRPSGELGLLYAPISLDPAFPIDGGHVYRQPAREITHLHVHDCFEVGYCHAGSGVFVVEDKIMPYGQGDISIINDTERHLASSTPDSTSDWSFISFDPGRLIQSSAEEQELLEIGSLCGGAFLNIRGRGECPDLVDTIVALDRELSTRGPGYRSAVRGLAWTLMAQVHRLPGRSRGRRSPKRGVERVGVALEFIARNYPQRIGVEELAELCHMSVTHFRRVFTKATGLSPLDYLTRLRVRMAGALLRSTDRQVVRIAMDVGYPTLSSFNRHFKAVTGTTPRAWRSSGPAG